MAESHPIENWRPVVGFAGYEVSDLGRIRSLARRIVIASDPRRLQYCKAVPPKMLRQWVGKNGYCYVSLGRGKKKTVHRLVLEAHGDAPQIDGADCAHLDGNKKNNAAKNLVWASRRQNNAHKQQHGTQPRGSQVPTAKLTEQEVLEIRVLLAAGRSRKSLAAEYLVSTSTIGDIEIRKKWKHV